MKIRLDKGAKQPTRAHSTDAGLDIYALTGGLIRPRQTTTFRTGVHVQLPPGTVGLLQPKSGLMVHRDILTFGVIDEGFDGEIMVHAFNFSDTYHLVGPGDKISQLLVVPVLYEEVEVVDEIQGGERGSAGFGSTGT